MSEIEVFGTKSAENAQPAEDCGSVYGRFASPEQLDGIRNMLFACLGTQRLASPIRCRYI